MAISAFGVNGESLCLVKPNLSPLLNRFFREKYTLKDHVSNTKLEKGDHYYIQTRHKDLFSHYNLILRKL